MPTFTISRFCISALLAAAGLAMSVTHASAASQCKGMLENACLADGDCRTGYTCLKEIGLASGGTSTYSNGLCVPGDCSETGCPTGYTCQAVTDSSGNMRNVCGR